MLKLQRWISQSACCQEACKQIILLGCDMMVFLRVFWSAGGGTKNSWVSAEEKGGPGRCPGEEILEGSSRLIFISKLSSSTRAVGVVAFDESAFLSKPMWHPWLDLHREWASEHQTLPWAFDSYAFLWQRMVQVSNGAYFPAVGPGEGRQ